MGEGGARRVVRACEKRQFWWRNTGEGASRQEAEMPKIIAFSEAADFRAASRQPTTLASLIARGKSWLDARRVHGHDQQIERYINEHGGALTDSLEREISQRFVNANPGRY
jgi:hypothetical protein